MDYELCSVLALRYSSEDDDVINLLTKYSESERKLRRLEMEVEDLTQAVLILRQENIFLKEDLDNAD